MHAWPLRNSVILLTLLVGCGDSPDKSDAPKPVESNGASFVPVDFQPQANLPLSEFEGIPAGGQTFEGVNYQIGPKFLQVGSTVFLDYPREIPGIAVDKTCKAIHFLHASQGGAFQRPGHPKHEKDGVPIGRYVVHYADGETETVPIIYGQGLRDAWDWDNNTPAASSKLVWTGDNPKAGKYGRKLRFYWAIWENPHPEKPIATMDFLSANAKAAPFCLAISLEPITK